MKKSSATGKEHSIAIGVTDLVSNRENPYASLTHHYPSGLRVTYDTQQANLGTNMHTDFRG